MPAVVGIDLSLTSTGLAALQNGVVTLMNVTSRGATADTLVERHRRLLGIGMQVMGFVYRVEPDLVVIEAPSFASKYGHPHDRSGLWWLTVNALLADGIPVATAPPTVRAKYATGKGNAPKDLVLTDVCRRYPDAGVTKNDLADALVLAAMGARHLGQPAETSLPAAHLAAMDGVAWPAM